jgi:hypothetical protein
VEPSLDLDRTPALPDQAPRTIAQAVRDGVLDAELAGRLWILIDGGVPLVVAGPRADRSDRSDRADVLGALLDLIPSTRQQQVLDGSTEDFPWLADAEGLGWVRSSPAEPKPSDPGATTLLAGELGIGPPAELTGDRARLLVRALGRGFGLAATIEAVGLEEVLGTLRRRPIFLTDDELSNLGIVLVLGQDRDDVPKAVDRSRAVDLSSPVMRRVVAAHYVRPLARDVHGHVQRLPPAVLATWDERIRRFEHFAWGIAAELALRVGRTAGDFEAESERRADVLAALAAGTDELPDRPALRAFLERQRALLTSGPTVHRH